ncbi:hypothetical protein MILUP08_41409 [Micromonospora lupini str. Lupac 08]|uniref:Uncharacterized protein n=1 Tax=Micromonospora lupini str. Lupac 08 TaxID=1150864 RepID=I0KY48_9ACTN|nr:hypothetical protein MILUP08_41409 [Micromonospora lupini str. Lupac 08]
MVLAPSSSGPGRRPLKAVAPVRIRSGLHLCTTRLTSVRRVVSLVRRPFPVPDGAQTPRSPLPTVPLDYSGTACEGGEQEVLAPSSSGPGRRPLKAVAPVRIRSGLQPKGSSRSAR